MLLLCGHVAQKLSHRNLVGCVTHVLPRLHLVDLVSPMPSGPSYLCFDDTSQKGVPRPAAVSLKHSQRRWATQIGLHMPIPLRGVLFRSGSVAGRVSQPIACRSFSQFRQGEFLQRCPFLCGWHLNIYRVA